MRGDFNSIWGGWSISLKKSEYFICQHEVPTAHWIFASPTLLRYYNQSPFCTFLTIFITPLSNTQILQPSSSTFWGFPTKLYIVILQGWVVEQYEEDFYRGVCCRGGFPPLQERVQPKNNAIRIIFLCILKAFKHFFQGTQSALITFRSV